MLEKIAKIVGFYPKTVIGIIFLLTICFGGGLSKLTIETDDRSMLPEGNPVVAAFDNVDETFGGAQFAMIILDMDNVFTTEALQKIERLTNELERVKGVSSALSITNVQEIRGIDGGIEVAELIEEIPTNYQELQKMKDRILSDKDYSGQIVSENFIINEKISKWN